MFLFLQPFQILSLLPIQSPPHHQFEKMLCISEVAAPLRGIQKFESHPEDRLWIHFRSSHTIQQEEQIANLVTVDIPKLYKNVVINNHRHSHQKIDQYKYTIFKSHRFSKYISYDEFCELEYVLGDIIQSYIEDKTKSYGIIVDEIFLQPDSFFYEKNGKNPKKKIFSRVSNFCIDRSNYIRHKLYLEI